MDSDLQSALRTTGFKQLVFKYTIEEGEEIRPSYQHLMRRADSLEKTLMLGRIGEQEEKEMTEDEMAGWHHQLDGLESG